MAAEELSKDDKPSKPLTPAELRAKAKELEADGLCDSASIYYYSKWIEFGGQQRGMTPLEILQQPAWLLDDFSLISRYTSDERDKVKRNKPKKPTKRGRH